MGRQIAGLGLLVLALNLLSCDELLEPQAKVTRGQGSGSIDQMQAVAYNGPRARIAVANFDQKAAKGYRQLGEGMADMLATELVNTNRYIVLERQELGAVTAEQDLARSGRVMPGTGAPTGQIEGAELLVMGAITEFEPNYQGGGVGAVLLNRRHPAAAGGGIKQAYVAIDLRVVDTRTSRIVAATSVTGKATDIGGLIGGVVGGGRSRLGLGLGAFRNTPMEKAVRVCLAKAIQFVVSRTPANYYHYDQAGRPAAAGPAAQNVPVETIRATPAGQPAPAQPAPAQPAPAQPAQAQPAPAQPAPAGALPARVYVAFAEVKVYEKPDATAKVVGTATRGTALPVQAQEGQWYFVTLAGGKGGWLLKAFTSATAPK